MECRDVGPADPDIAGIGMILGFAIQAYLSVIVSYCSLIIWSRATKLQKQSTRDKKKATDNLLIRFNELAVLSGLGLLICGVVQRNKLSLYHLSVLTAIINFISTSLCVTAISIANSTPTQGIVRKLYFSAFIVLYVVFVSFLIIRLGRWDADKASHCFYFIEAQPRTYQLMVGVVCGIYAISLILVFGYRLRVDKSLGEGQLYDALRDELERSASSSTLPSNPMGSWGVVLAGVQGIICSLGVVLTAKLRTANSGYLSGGSEYTWGFGQTFSVVLAVSNITACFQEVDSYWKVRSARSR